MDFLKGLNPQQRDAVEHTEGPLLILAGAGSGKTRVITHRAAHIIQSRKAPASAVAAVTFTNKAADEMRDRVASLLSGVYCDSQPAISTFHSFCVRLLRRDGRSLADLRPGFTPTFSIYDEDDQLMLVKSAYRHLGLDEKLLQYRMALSSISKAKNRKQTPEDLARQAKDPRSSNLATIFELYEAELRKANALDFDDLLLEAVRLLRHDDEIRDVYNRRLSYLMVDEYQDTNRSQYELMRLLTEQHHNICVVGDEDQSIYSWRGADIRNILDFERDFRAARVIRLEQNYRSTKNILDAAGALVANNAQRKGKSLWTEAGAGALLSLYPAPDAESEALFIADTIERLLGDYPDDRVAVLYRTNAQSRQIEEALRRCGRSYLVVGGFSFYQRAEIKDIVAYLKLALGENDSVSLMRIINTPARGIGKTTVEQLEKLARAQGVSLWVALNQTLDAESVPARAQVALKAFRDLIVELAEAVKTRRLDEAIRLITARTGYKAMLERDDSPASEGRLENLGELANAAAEAVERGETAADFLDHVALVADADALDEKAQVVLMTMHNAKGLEFPTVFLAGLEDGLCPHSRSVDSDSMLEEERRLCYVGMTRAEKRLYLSWARYRRRFGGGEQERTTRSRFLEEIPSRLVTVLGESAGVPQVNLEAERYLVRDAVSRNTYTGKTYNSLENIAQFFQERGVKVPQKVPAPAVVKPLPAPPKASTKPSTLGARVEHPKYGTGVVVRREGEGDDVKVTVSFPRVGLKKLVEKYAGLKRQS